MLKHVVPAIAWAHRAQGLKIDSENSLLRDILLGLKKKLAVARKPKEVISAAHIKAIVGKLDMSCLSSLRVTVMIVLGFAAFLRFDELASLLVSELEFSENCVIIRIQSQKPISSGMVIQSVFHK